MADASLGTAVLRTRLDNSGLRAGLTTAQTEVQRTFTDVNGRLRDANGRFVKLGDDGAAAFGKVGDGARRAMPSFEAVGQKFTQLGETLTGLGTKLSVFVTAPLTAIAGLGIRSAMQLETFSASLRVLIGDAERANRVFDELYEFSANVPFDWRTISEGTRVLAAFGTEAEQIVPTLSMIGDIASGTQSDLVGLAEIYGRVQVTGRLSMQEVNSLALRGVPIYTELAKVVGVSTEEVRGLISTGTIGFPQLQQVFTNLTSSGGQFFGMMEAQAEITQGRLNRLKDSFEQVTDVIGVRLLPAFDRLIAIGQSASDWFVNLDESTQSTLVTIGTLAAAIGPLTLAFGGLLTVIGKIPAALTAVRAGMTLLRTTMLPFLGPAGILIGAALAYTALSNAFDAGRSAREQAQASFDALVGRMESYRQALNITSEAERQAAEENLARQRRVLEVTIQHQQAFVRALEADVIAFANKGFFGQLFSFGEANVNLNALDQAEGQLRGLLRELGQIDTTLEEVRAWTPGSTSPSLPAPVVSGGTVSLPGLPPEAIKTVETVFSELGEAGARSVAETTRLIAAGLDEAEATEADLRRRIGLLSSTQATLLRDFYDEVTDAQLGYLIQRQRELQAELQSVLNPAQAGRYIPNATEPGGAIPESILGPVMLPFRDTPEGIIPALVGEMDPAAIQAARDSLSDYQKALEELGRVGRETAVFQRELAAAIADPFGTALRDAMREQAGRDRNGPDPIGRSGASGPTDEENFIRGLMVEYEAAEQAASEARRSLNNYNLSLEEMARRGREASVAQREAAQAQAELTAALRAQKEELRAQPYDPFAGFTSPSRFGDGGNAPGGSRLQEWADKQQEAANRFAEVVVNAGFRFTDSLINAIRSGDIGAAFKAVLGAGQSIIGGMNLGSLSFLGGSIGIAGLISGVLGIIGSLIGGGRSSDEQRRREMAQQSRSVPAVNINFTMNQENRIEASLAGANLEATMRRVTVTAMEDFWARSGIEARLAKLGV